MRNHIKIRFQVIKDKSSANHTNIAMLTRATIRLGKSKNSSL
jgi:hypothetical protein